MDKKTDKESLLRHFDYAIDSNGVVELFLSIKDYPQLEIIKVPTGNLKFKKKYINEYYNDDLTHKHSEGVKIERISVRKNLSF